MPFSSPQFIFVFLPIAVCGFWAAQSALGRTAATIWLTTVSVAFYLYSGVRNVAIIVPFVLLNYIVARAILGPLWSNVSTRRSLFVIGVITNIVFLGYFKYKNLFLETTNSLLGGDFAVTATFWPLGISFLVFQQIAFLADVFAGKVVEIRLLDFMFFSLFFPRTIAGPLVRYGELVPQLASLPRRLSVENIAVGICLFSIGLFKKSVIADSVAEYVSYAFDMPFDSHSQTLLFDWVGIGAYAMQIYFDFSGYSDMALGSARIFGIQLPYNFNSPYKASSIIEFWSRWHITLTRFLTDYIYTPMALAMARRRMASGKPLLRGKRSRLSEIAIFVGGPTLSTMAISGLWHGPSWHFLIWGLLHGVFLVINQAWRMRRDSIKIDLIANKTTRSIVARVLTLSCVAAALVFFRAPTIGAAASVLRGAVGLNGILPYDIQFIRHFGVTFDWITAFTLMEYTRLLNAFAWIGLLLCVVLLIPNSLDLLRRFRPALEFSVQTEFPADTGTVLNRSPDVTSEVRSSWETVRRALGEGVPLNWATATIAATAFILGLLAMDRNARFIYWNF